MKLDIADLERLATILESKARTADAKAHEHAQAREMEDSEKEHKRAMSGRYFAGVCREAHRRLAVKTKRTGFQPPAWEELIEYAKARHPVWPAADVLQWFNHFESNGWKVSGKTTMVNWQRAADNGFARWLREHPQAAAKPGTNPRTSPDPEGWREFLKSLNRPYKEYRFEQDWVRTEFRASRKK
jgi:hypothetical protein